MDIAGWDQRYESESAQRQADRPPTALVLQAIEQEQPGHALDLACGSGRNSLELARLGWRVTAIDGSAKAIELLRWSAQSRGLSMTTRVADLQSAEFHLPEAQWDLVLICYYLQRDLLEAAKRSVRPGGQMVVVVHTTEGQEEEPTQSRLRPGELQAYFADWQILHRYEGKPADPEHKRAVSEIIARRPAR